MRKLPKPTDEFNVPYVAGDVFKLCIERVRNPNLKQRLRAVRENIASAETDYDAAAIAATLHTFPRVNNIASTVTKKEMITTYTARMVAKSQPGRPVYDRLVAAAPNGRCPLCGLGKADSLDHHLPKAIYPILAVTPINLVPSCDWCQNAKDDTYPQTVRTQTLHPYYDNVDTEQWLTASVVQDAPASFSFDVTPPASWNGTVMADRVRHHMKTFKLATLFTVNAADELVDIRQRLVNLKASGGVEAVRLHLTAEAQSRRHARLNSWQTAMYQAAAANQWFCDVGFALE